MYITGTHIHYYHLCHRKLWLFHHGIRMEHESALVAKGKFIHETAYTQRAEKWTELQLDGIRIDYYDPKRQLVREVKKTKKRSDVHIAQLKFYLWTLTQHSVPVKAGVLEYPKLRATENVQLTAEDHIAIPKWCAAIRTIIGQENCPKVIRVETCKSCAYYEFCYT